MSSSYERNGQAHIAQQYLRQQIEQAGPVEQVLMLYDGAMRFLLQTRAAIERKDIQARYNANKRAQDILGCLIDMVNPETGGEAGKKLFSIYTSMLKRMMQIDFENSVQLCDELVLNFKSLRGGVAQALARQQGVKPAASSGSGVVVAAPASPDTLPEGMKRNAVA